MRTFITARLLLLGAVILLSCCVFRGFACTDGKLTAADGSVVTFRTMDFDENLRSSPVITPRGFFHTSPGPNGQMGISWKNKFAFLHMDVADFKASACDGINEAGLSVGALYLPGYTQYEEVSPLMHAYALSNLCFVGWALGNYATVAEVIAALPDVLVWGEPLVSQKSFVPLHYALHDSNGTSAVIEFVDGAARVYNNTVGVVTNSPTYDWHMQNLGNYIHLQPFDVESQQWLNGYITAPGQGSGLRGLPGDPTPPSRFISTAAALAFTDPPKTVEEALTLAQHLSNRVDIPRGLVRKRTWDGLVRSDYTQWTVFRDHSNRKLYYRTYDNLQLQVLQL